MHFSQWCDMISKNRNRQQNEIFIIQSKELLSLGYWSIYHFLFAFILPEYRMGVSHVYPHEGYINVPKTTKNMPKITVFWFILHAY